MIQYDYDIKCTCLEEPKRLKFDLDLSPDVSSTSCSLTNYCVNCGDVLFVELKPFRKQWYVNCTKYGENAKVKSRFNINLGQLPVFKQAIGQ